jgi:hypothetical protein
MKFFFLYTCFENVDRVLFRFFLFGQFLFFSVFGYFEIDKWFIKIFMVFIRYFEVKISSSGLFTHHNVSWILNTTITNDTYFFLYDTVFIYIKKKVTHPFIKEKNKKAKASNLG